MNSHRHIRLLLYDYLTAGLQREQKSLVQSHLEHCTPCRICCEDIRKSIFALPPDRNPAGDLPPAFWQELLNDLSARLPARPKHRNIPAWIGDWMEFIAVPRHQAIAGAVTLVITGAIVSGTWFVLRPEPVRQQIAATAPAVTPSPGTAVNSRLKHYLRKSKALLVGLNNMPLEEGSPVDLSLERTTSRALLQEARYLKDQPLDGRSAALISDLEKIQIALANTRDTEEVPGVRLIRGGIQEQNLLFKIRITETVFQRIDDESQHSER